MRSSSATARAAEAGPTVAAALGAAVVGLTGVRGGDYPAHLLRAELWDRAGVSVWNFHWYGGHATPTYSVISPPLVAVFGAFSVVAVSSVAATWLFGRLVLCWSRSGWALVGLHVFALASVVNVIVGRVPFALGLALALLSLDGWRRGRFGLAISVSVCVPLASPVVAVFLAIASAAWVVDALVDRRCTRSTGMAATVLASVSAPMVALTLTFSTTGRFPFRPDQAAFSIALMVLLAVLTDQRVVRIGMLIAAAVSVAVFSTPNPLGGNFLRFTQFVVVPLCMVAFGLTRRSAPVIFAVIALVATGWSLQFGVVSTVAWSGDESTSAEFHRPLVDEVRRRNLDGMPVGRLEIPFTENHWESYFVATSVPFARGWERQVDLELNAELYDEELDAAGYRRWILHNAVRWVALPDAALDGGGEVEAALIRSGAVDDWLTPVWSSADWVLYEVTGYRPIVDRPAALAGEAADDVLIDVTAAATFTVRYRYVEDMSVSPAGCVTETSDGWMRVTVPAAGRYTLRVDPDSVVVDGDVCAGG